jgi:hypothetical protein
MAAWKPGPRGGTNTVDAQVQAQPADAPDHIGMGVRLLLDIIVVESDVTRKAELPPVLDQANDHESRRDASHAARTLPDRHRVRCR